MKYEENYNSYLKTKRKIFYIFSCLLVICSIIFVLPNLSKNLNDYDKSVEVFKKSRINSIERHKGLSIEKDSELIITMQNGREWIFDEQFEKYWKEIGDSSNIGKTFVIYTRGFTDSNPSQIEIEKKIIYNLGTLDKPKYLFLILTFVCLIFSIFDYRKYRNKKSEMEI